MSPESERPSQPANQPAASRAALAAVVASAPLALQLAVWGRLVSDDLPELVHLGMLALSPMLVYGIIAAVAPSVRSLWPAALAVSAAFPFLSLLAYPIAAASGVVTRFVLGSPSSLNESRIPFERVRLESTAQELLTWMLLWMLLFGIAFMASGRRVPRSAR
jgi:hypothetical protein